MNIFKVAARAPGAAAGSWQRGGVCARDSLRDHTGTLSVHASKQLAEDAPTGLARLMASPWPLVVVTAPPPPSLPLPPPSATPTSINEPTSGSRLLPEGAEALMKERVFPRATMITPNLVEAEALVGRSLRTPTDVEAGAASLLASSAAGGVLIKGGHSNDENEADSAAAGGVPRKGLSAGRYSQDYWTDGTPGGSFWLTAPRVDSDNTHGTGCTLSSAAAACLALGFDPADSVVIAKAYVTQGIRVARRFGKGPGPVAHTGWPSRSDCFPWVTATAESGGSGRPDAFPRCHDDWGLYPVVESAEW